MKANDLESAPSAPVADQGSEKIYYSGAKIATDSPEKEQNRNYLQRFFWSFTRDTRDGDDEDAGELQQDLKPRHLTMIAMGGCIGTGLFVATGEALQLAGPASMLIAYMIVGLMLHMTMHTLGELTAVFPVAGSFSTYSTRFLDPAWGFAMGWNYTLQWLTVLPLELVAASLTVNFWDQNKSDHAIFVTIFIMVFILFNLFGVRAFGEAEFFFGIMKVTAVIGYIIFAIICNAGGIPGQGYIGGAYWRDPGAFNNGFKGFCSIFVLAACSFSGTEVIGLTTSECKNPSKDLPKAIRQIFWRIVIFYITSLVLIGLVVPFNEPRLRGTDKSVMVSPFVISLQNAGVSVLPSVMNAVIFLSIISVGNSSIYSSSRTLVSMAKQGLAPKIFCYIDRKGRPIIGMLLALVFGLLGYTVNCKNQAEVLEWLLSLSGLSSIFTWGSICLSHIRFRQAWIKQGHSNDDLIYQSPYGIWGSIIALGINCLVVVVQFWTGAWPVNYGEVNQAETFFKAFICTPILMVLYFSYKMFKKTKIISLDQMDLITERKCGITAGEARKALMLERETMSMPQKIWSYLC